MSYATNRAALRAHYESKTPIAIARVNLSALGGKKFTPPALPSLAGLSAPQILTALAGAVHIRVELVGAGRGGARFLHLGADASTETRGQILQRIFYPDGYGDAFLASIIPAAMGVFHPEHTVDSGEIRFEETEEPDWIPPDPDSPKWASIEIATNYFAHRQIAAA